MTINTVAIDKALTAAFRETLGELMKDGYRGDEMRLRLVTDSKGSSEKYGWLGDVPVVREWLGNKTAETLKDYSFEIQNRDFYSAIEIDRNELDDDRVDMIRPRIGMLSRAVMDHMADLIIELLKAGDTGLAYDGLAFFSNATGARVNDNLLAGTGITVAQIQADLASARAAAMAFKTDQGRYMRINLDTIVCPAGLEMKMLQAIHSDLAGAGGEKIHNPLKDWFKAVVPVPELDDDDANDWYAFASGYSIKPFIYQKRSGPTLMTDDTEVKKNRKLVFSAEMRGNAGYGFPQLAIKVVNT